jgi:outer membrane protein
MTLAALAIAAPLSAQQPAAAAPPSDAHVKSLIETAMTNLQVQPPTTGKPLPGQGPRLDLSADEAVARAMERNVTLASQRLTPRTFDYQVAAAWANYRPNLTSALITSSATSLPARTTEGSTGEKTIQDTSNWNAGMTQNLKWGGGNLNVGWNNDRTESNVNNATFNPNFNSLFNVQYRQPLLLNFKTDNNRTNLLTTRISQTIAEVELQATIASTVAQVRNAYWELVYAQLNLEAQRASYDLSTRLVNDNRARVEIGTMAPIDVVQAQAEQATRRQTVVNAEATLRNSELALKRLIVSGTDDPLWTATLNTTDRPAAVAEAIDLEGAVRNALANRSDLVTAKRNIESAGITLRNLSNQTLPQMDVTTTYRLQGRGGVPTNPESGFPISGWGNALRNLGTFEAPTWTVRMDFAYPIGTSAAEANKARQQIVIQQGQTQVKALELQIATEITTAVLAVTSSLEAVQAAQVARELSDQRASAAQSKLDVGMATNFEVVQAQRDLADARNRELREQLNYRRALVDLQRAQVSPR